MDRDTTLRNAGGGQSGVSHGPVLGGARRGRVEPATPGDEAGGSAIASAERMSLAELTEAAGVSVRTVRYYIAEGLLPPPDGAGPGSSYSREHLDRLRLIQRLKEAYFPLKEIRRQLAGLDDAAVRAILSGEEESPGPSDPWSVPEVDASLAGARRYLAMLESRERYRTEPMALQFAAQRPPVEPPEAMQEKRITLPEAVSARPGRHQPTPERQAVERRQEAGADDGGLWRRITLGDGAELVISERVYSRHRDRIDWLVRWARKVFD